MYGNRKNIAHDIVLSGNNLLVTGYFDDTSYFENTASVFLVSEGMVQNTDNVFFAKYQLDFTNGINSINANSESIKIYPNPFSNQFAIILPSDQTAAITVYNIFGKSVYRASVISQQSAINFSSFPSGIYFLSANINNQLQTFKIIKL